MRSTKRFVELYMEAYKQGLTRKQFSQKASIKLSTLNSKFYKLRKDGVQLPSLARPKNQLNVDELNKIIKEK